MPYYPRRRRYRKKTKTAWYNKKYSAKGLALKAIKNVHYIKGLVNSEMFHQELNNQTLGGAQNSITHLTSISQSDGMAGRTGNSILVRSISIKGFTSIGGSASQTRVRLALIQDKQQVADTSPSVANIYEDPLDPHSLLQTNNLGRFKVLRTFVINLSSNSLDTKSFEIYKKLYLHVRYNGATTSDIQKNGIYLVQINNESTNFPTVNANIRLNYHDN